MSEPTPAPAEGPRLSIQAQYVKDLSFESPRAPQSLAQGAPRPEIQVGVDVRVSQLGPGQFEVVLQLNLDAKSAGEPTFVLELAYGAVAQLQAVPQEQMQLVLFIEVPRLIFPFARRIIADATRDGGMPPLMLDPIDFLALHRHRVEQAQRQQNGEAPTATA
jgi:preprotein translocase subunit SecB